MSQCRGAAVYDQGRRGTMVSIIICDDDEYIRSQLKDFLLTYIRQRQLQAELSVLGSGQELRSKDLSQTDILILDIQLGSENGIEIARKIRRTNESLLIIFITNFVQYAIDGYEVNAFHFLQKPILYERFEQVVGDAISRVTAAGQEMVCVKNTAGIHKILVRDIIYCETNKGHVMIHLSGGQVIVCFSSMASLERMLRKFHFFRCHTAFLVNLGYVKNWFPKDVMMTDESLIPVSKYRKKEFMEVLTDYWGDQFL